MASAASLLLLAQDCRSAPFGPAARGRIVALEIHGVIDDPCQRRIPASGTVVLFAVGLVARVLSPTPPNAQEQLRLESEIENPGDGVLEAVPAEDLVLPGGC